MSKKTDIEIRQQKLLLALGRKVFMDAQNHGWWDKLTELPIFTSSPDFFQQH